MNLTAIDSASGEASALSGLFADTTGLPTNFSTESKAFTAAGDSWLDTFMQRAEEGLLSQQKEDQAAAIAQPQGALIANNNTDSLTGLLRQADTSSAPAYPGYLLSYTPGQALENRPAVAQWQAQMQQRGWSIEVDGLFGPQSDRIARQFQQEKGLAADGIVGPQTWRATFDNSTITGNVTGNVTENLIENLPGAEELEISDPLEPLYAGTPFGYNPFAPLSYDADAQTFQQRLQALNWRIEADGLFGPSSEAITRAFQRQVGLPPDGIVGPLTWDAVFAESAPIAPSEPSVRTGGIRPISEVGLDLIRDFEGRRLNAYQDAVGVWTIGYGHTRTAYPGQRITEAGAVALLRSDVATFERAVSQAVQVPLTDNQYAALVSFAFNVGSSALNSSTLLRRLNAGDYGGAANELLRWNRAGGRELYGLTRRREAERALFLS